MKRAALLALASGLAAVACGQASGHTASPIATPPDSAFHPVTDDLPPAHQPLAVIDDLGQPTLLPKPSIDVPTPVAVIVPRATPAPTPKPTPRPTPQPTPRPTATRPPVIYPTVADAKAYALSVLGSTQYSCLDEIAIHESNWNPHDYNASSGAYGIPQALPGSKMSTAGADWLDNPVTQVKWMIGYVDGSYGSACSAWTFWQAHHWY